MNGPGANHYKVLVPGVLGVIDRAQLEGKLSGITERYGEPTAVGVRILLVRYGVPHQIEIAIPEDGKLTDLIITAVKRHCQTCKAFDGT